jgi:hypothetical protein
MEVILAFVAELPVDTVWVITRDKLPTCSMTFITIFCSVTPFYPPIAIRVVALFCGRGKDITPISATALGALGRSVLIVLRLSTVTADLSRHCDYRGR